MMEVSPEATAMVGNLLQILGSFISTLSSAVSQKELEAKRERELAEALRRLNALQAELDELRCQLGAVNLPPVQTRSRRS